MSDQDDKDLDSEFDLIFSDLDAEPAPAGDEGSKATMPPPASPAETGGQRPQFPGEPSKLPPNQDRPTAACWCSVQDRLLQETGARGTSGSQESVVIRA